MNAAIATRPWNDRLALAAIIVVLVASPWPLGSRLPWASMLFASFVIAAAACWIAATLWSGRKITLPSPLLFAALFLLWTGGQWVTGATIYAHATAYEWIRMLSYTLVFWMAATLTTDRRAALTLWRVIIGMGILIGAFGLIQFMTWNGSVLWFYEPAYSGTPFGPFNNRNYFAGYLAVTLPPGIAVVFGREQIRRRGLLLCGLWLAVLGLLVSLSRGGTIALIVAGGFLYVIVGSHTHRDSAPTTGWSSGLHLSRRATVAIAIVALVAGLAWFGQTDRVLARLETVFQFQATPSMQGRLVIWRESLPMIQAHPIAGFGLNTYMMAFPAYRRAPTRFVETNAHNEYLEMVVETGLVGALFCLGFLLLLLRQGRTNLRTATDRQQLAIRGGAMAGWIAVMTYGLTDFPTVIPAIDYVLAVLAGLMVANFDAWDETGRR